MTFAELLREYIGGATLETIVDQCRRRGVKMDRIYLGRLRSGDRLPPDDDSTIKSLAEVCGRDAEPLLFMADAVGGATGTTMLLRQATFTNSNAPSPSTIACS